MRRSRWVRDTDALGMGSSRWAGRTRSGRAGVEEQVHLRPSEGFVSLVPQSAEAVLPQRPRGEPIRLTSHRRRNSPLGSRHSGWRRRLGGGGPFGGEDDSERSFGGHHQRHHGVAAGGARVGPSDLNDLVANFDPLFFGGLPLVHLRRPTGCVIGELVAPWRERGLALTWVLRVQNRRVHGRVEGGRP